MKTKEDFWKNIRDALSRRQKKSIARTDLKPSAVIFPLLQKGTDIHILFTKRTSWVENHKGQISFPGGRFQETDATLKSTALREAQEEIGVIAEDAVLLGELDDVETMVSNFRISPFVAALPYSYEFRINREEVDSIITLPLKSFLDCTNFHTDGREGVVPPYFNVEDKIIWGATARILINFLTILYPKEWNCPSSVQTPAGSR